MYYRLFNNLKYKMIENQITPVNSKTTFDKVSFLVLAITTFLIPIFFVPSAFVPLQFGTRLIFASGIILSVFIYILSVLKTKSIDLPGSNKYILCSMLAVPFLYVLTWGMGGFSRSSFFGHTFEITTVGFMLLSFVYLFLVSVFFRNKNYILYSYISFIFAALVVEIFLIIRIIFGAKVLSFGFFTTITNTTIGSWNNTSVFFGVVAILLVVGFHMLNIKKVAKFIFATLVLLSLFFVALINFVMVWVLMAMSLFIFIAYSLFVSNKNNSDKNFWKNKINNLPIFATFVLILSVVFVLWGGSFGTYLSNKFEVSNLEVRPSLSVTMDIARNTLKTKPFFGSGVNSFGNQWLLLKPDDVLNTPFWNIDFANGAGLIPTFAVTTGIVGIISWLLFFGYYLYLGFKSFFTKIDDSFVRYSLLSSFIVSLYLWIVSFVYIPSTVVFLMTFFFTGIFFASVYLVGLIKIKTVFFSKNYILGFTQVFFFVVVFVSCGWFAYGLWNNSKSTWYFQKSHFAANQLGDISSSEEYMIKALRYAKNDVYFRALSQIEMAKLNTIVYQNQNNLKQGDIQEQFSSVLSKAINFASSARDIDPSNYLNWISLGQVYEFVSSPALKIEGSYDKSEFSYKEALKLNPKNPMIPLFLSRLALTKGDMELARQYAMQSILLKRNYLDAYFLLSQIEVADKNLKGAIDAITASSVIDPTNPAIFFQLGLLKYNQQDFNGAIEVLEKAVSMTPDYANAKYFLGLSYEATKQHDKAISQFEQLRITNPESKDVELILENLKSGKSIFTNNSETNPGNVTKLPVKESIR